jgi:hypothetical protein
MSAVSAPVGSSRGASTVRAAVSAIRTSTAPASADGTGEQSHEMRHHQSHVADCSPGRDCRASQQGRRDEDYPAYSRRLDAQCKRIALADHHQVQCARLSYKDAHGRQRRYPDHQQAGETPARQITQQPDRQIAEPDVTRESRYECDHR